MDNKATRTEQLRLVQRNLQRLWDDIEVSKRIFGEQAKRTVRLIERYDRIEEIERSLLRTGELMETRKPYTRQVVPR